MSQLVARLAELLEAAGSDSARAEAELICGHVLGVGRAELMTAPAPDPEGAERAEAYARRRAAGEPLQYVLGTACSGALDLEVGPGVFIPRPETELLLVDALERLRGLSEPVVVDLCGGSGYLALEIAHARPDARVHVVELSEEALVWLHRNARNRRTAGDTGVVIHHADATSPDLLAELAGRVDVIVTNPPYIPSGASKTLPSDVVGAEPHPALFGGSDGLEVIRPLVARAADLLAPGGSLLIEHDDTTSHAVAAVIDRTGRFGTVERHADLAGRPRYVTAVLADQEEEHR